MTLHCLDTSVVLASQSPEYGQVHTQFLRQPHEILNSCPWGSFISLHSHLLRVAKSILLGLLILPILTFKLRLGV
jgi:hypothetical protein